MTHETRLDVIVRFHDERRLRELERAIFSLVGQSYRPLHIYLILQRFTTEAIQATRGALAPFLTVDDSPGLSILNWEHPEPCDARSALINLGLRVVQGRYVAFLDYDDALYPEAYELLVEQLRTTGVAIAFGGICVKRVEVYDSFLYTLEKKPAPFVAGSNLRDLLRNNFCPIHSYVLDRSRIPEQLLFFDPFMSKLEDYDFLLRICSQFPSDFTLLNTVVGEYYYKNDGSNTVPTGWGDDELVRAGWNEVAAFIEQRRRTTPIAAPIQRALGLANVVPGLTIRDFLDRY